MAREIDYSQPLSEEDISYLKQRLPLNTVEHLVRVAGESEVSAAAAAPATAPPAGPSEAGTDGPFDPSKHKVSEVQAYLLTASAEEAQRVLREERAGRARQSILD